MSKRTTRTGEAAEPAQKLRHEAGPGLSRGDGALLAIFVTSLVLIPMALFAMNSQRGATASIKYLLVGIAAAGAAYGVNKFAVDRMAPLHAIGFNLAGALAIVGILLTGAGTALGSFTAIVFGSVEARIYEAAGRDLAQLIGETNATALVAERMVPAVDAVVENIAQTSACERQSSCLSKVGNGGRGSMSRALDRSASAALSIVQAIQDGQLERSQLLEKLNRLNTEYQDLLSDNSTSLVERRADLQGLHSEARQVAIGLSEAMPMGVLESYVRDLQAGATISGDPSGSRILSAYLRDHGDELAEQMDALPESDLALPEFPDRPGMIEVLKFLPDFIAIAAIVIVGEMILPITLYLSAYFGIVWELEKLRGNQRTAAKESTISRLIKRFDDTDGDDQGLL